jgi:dipeptidase E
MGGLVFYSNQFEPNADEVDAQLLNLIRKANPTIGYIPSCSDPVRKFFGNCQEYYGRYGCVMPVYFELDVDFQPQKKDALFACDAIHLTGGNTYNFLHWLRVRGMMQPLRDYVAQGGVLIGVSAGAILMTPDISSTDLCGDQSNFPAEDTSALHLADFSFVPHIEKQDHKILQNYAREHQVTLYGCHDEDGIIVENGKSTFIGDVLKYTP